MAKWGWKAATTLCVGAGLAASSMFLGKPSVQKPTAQPTEAPANTAGAKPKIAYVNVDHIRQMSSKNTLLIGLCSEQVFTRNGIGPQFTEVLDTGGVYQKIPSRMLSVNRPDICKPQ